MLVKLLLPLLALAVVCSGAQDESRQMCTVQRFARGLVKNSCPCCARGLAAGTITVASSTSTTNVNATLSAQPSASASASASATASPSATPSATVTATPVIAGSVRCWGAGGAGQLGYGNTNNLASPGADVTVGGSVAAVTVGSRYTCALWTNGSVYCWGRGGDGQLGYGNTNHLASPGPGVNVGGPVAAIAAGDSHMCALLTSGSVRCWGSGYYGQLGYGYTNNLASPGPDVNVGGSVAAITAGGGHTCALLTNGSVRCWGWGGWGQLGYGNTDNLASPGPDVNVGGSVAAITAGAYHTCALLTSGSVRCWGGGNSGMLGYGNTNDLASPGPDVNVGGSVAAIAAGYSHTCALLTNGNVRCWGGGGWGQLGYGNTNDLASPGPDVNVGGSVAAIACGGAHMCVLLANGSARCWGGGGWGQLGYGNTNSLSSPGPDVNVGGTVAAIAAGEMHTCALVL